MPVTKSKIILEQIEADKHNIQEMINLLKTAKKTKYNQIQATIKSTIKDIKKQKEFINDTLYKSPRKVQIPLFEVQPSEIQSSEIDEFSTFFGLLE